jgi:ferric-dicitrate binding protein FerR (iron transport regulator)
MNDHLRDPIEDAIKLAGPRATAADAARARVRANVHDAWTGTVRLRRRRQVVTWTLSVAAAAAVIAIAISINWRQVKTPAAASAIARLLASTGAVQIESPGATARTIQLGDQVSADAVVRTTDARATFALLSGGEVRVDAGTVVRFTGARAMTLERGGIYLDSGGAQTGLAVTTPAGTVHDIGTRFEVRVIDRAIHIRVREGRIALEHGGVRDEASYGTELVAQPDGRVVSQPIAPYDPGWTWATRAAPVFRVEGATLAAFLDWIVREGGRAVSFADPALATTAGATVLHGSIEGLSIDDALTVILPTCGLTFEIQNDHVAIRRAKSSGE